MSHKVKGFTLIELIVVTAVFGVIMGAALSLVLPVRKVFTKGYNEENVSSSAQIIGSYLDQNLRYAENIVIRDTPPKGEDLINFVNDYYSGGVYKFKGDEGQDEVDNFKYVTGNVYVLKIDNTNSGLISRWDYQFTAGDRRVEGAEGFIDDAKTKKNESDDIAPEVKFIDKNGTLKAVAKTDEYNNSDKATSKYAVNCAIYDEQNYNLSLGIYQINDGKLTKDMAYYESFPEGSNLRDFGRENCGFTITVYPKKKKPTDPEPRTKDSTDVYTYQEARVFNQNLGLPNAVDNRQYLTFNWTYDGSDTVISADTTSGSNLVYKSRNNNAFINSVSNAAESPVIYIIYSYSETGTATT